MKIQLKKWHKIFFIGLMLVIAVVLSAEKFTEKSRAKEAQANLNLYLELRYTILFDFLKSMGTEVRSASTNHLVPSSAANLSMDWQQMSSNDKQMIEDVLQKKNDQFNLTNANKIQAQYLQHLQAFEVYAKKFIDHFGYYDLFLIASNGDVVYSFAKEKDFGTNLINGPYNKTALAEIYQRAMNLSAKEIESNKEVLIFSDFEAYAPSKGEPASFCGYPIQMNGKTIGVLALQIPTSYINKMMQFTAGMGTTGETYIVGHDKLMRSQSRFTEEQTALKKNVDTESVRLGLLGKKGTLVTRDYRGVKVISAFAPIDFGGHPWVVLAEIDAEEIYRGLSEWTMGVLVLGILVVAFTSFIYRKK